MTVRQAILYNVLSAMMAYLGMGVGIVIGHYVENVSMWIFALTAGLFMYVALVDMVRTALIPHGPVVLKQGTCHPRGTLEDFKFSKL